MSKKRRVFDIDMPDDETFPAGKVSEGLETKSMVPRRGPMATAIGENSRSLRERKSQEDAIRAENDALAHEHVRLKKLGLIVDLIPLELIDASKLVRDRAEAPDMDLEELIDSIKDIGLSNPIRVERNGERYELVQGMRRLSAFRGLDAKNPGGVLPVFQRGWWRRVKASMRCTGGWWMRIWCVRIFHLRKWQGWFGVMQRTRRQIVRMSIRRLRSCSNRPDIRNAVTSAASSVCWIRSVTVWNIRTKFRAALGWPW